MKFNISKKWIMENAHKEEGQSIEAGSHPPAAGKDGTAETDAKESLIIHMDAFTGSTYVVPSDFARQLERQRNEARSQLEQARRERDEAKATVECLEVAQSTHEGMLITMDQQLTASQSQVEQQREMIAGLRETLQGVINTACHPDIALRSVMVDLAPIRAAIDTAEPRKT